MYELFSSGGFDPNFEVMCLFMCHSPLSPRHPKRHCEMLGLECWRRLTLKVLNPIGRCLLDPSISRLKVLCSSVCTWILRRLKVNCGMMVFRLFWNLSVWISDFPWFLRVQLGELQAGSDLQGPQAWKAGLRGWSHLVKWGSGQGNGMKEVVLDVANSPNLAEIGQFVGEIRWTDATIRASCCSCKLPGEFSPVNLSKGGKLIRAKNLNSLFSCRWVWDLALLPWPIVGSKVGIGAQPWTRPTGGSGAMNVVAQAEETRSAGLEV